MKKNRIALVMLGALFILSLLGGCGQKDTGITISEVWARPGLAEGNSAVFIVVNNGSDAEDRLISASSDVAGAVELHKSSMVDGKMKMEMQKYIAIPANEEVVFKPGDFHVMLIGLHDDLAVGDQFEVSLQFESAGEILLDVVVREP